MKDRNFTVKIWDTAGQERYRSLTKNFYKNADGIIIVYDITDRRSFDMVHGWIQSVNNNSKINKPLMIIANKYDLSDSREVSIEDGQRLANYYNIPFFETSAKENTYVEEAFGCIINKIADTMEKKFEKEENNLPLKDFRCCM